MRSSVFCGAYRMYLSRSPEQDVVCPFLCCDHVPQTLTHMFVICPIARSAYLSSSVLLAQHLLWTRIGLVLLCLGQGFP